MKQRTVCIYPVVKRVACNGSCRYWINSPLYNNCSLDVANMSERTLAKTAEFLETTQAKVFQIEKRALEKLARRLKDNKELKEYLE